MHPRKSTTTEERYFHIRPAQDPSGNGGTVFCRKQEDGSWLGAASHISLNDTFCRKTGRSVSKRHFFARNNAQTIGLPKAKKGPTYEDAYLLFSSTRNQ